LKVLYSARNNLNGPTSALEFVAEHLGQKVKQLLASNFHFIYPHMVVHSKNTAEYQICVKFFERHSKLDVQQVEIIAAHNQTYLSGVKGGNGLDTYSLILLL
jgi:hypothetical protein